jgi:hypothetical protein
MRGRKLLGLVAAACVMLIGSAAPALALTDPSPGTNPAPNTNLHDGQAISVNWSGATANQLVFISECWRPQTDPNFVDVTTSCSSLSINPNSTAAGTGPATFNVFVGPDPNIGADACAFNAAQAAGAVLHTTCWIRIAPGDINATSGVLSLPITFADPNAGGGGGVPEAPLAILLPIGAATLVAGGYFYSRRRRAAAA